MSFQARLNIDGQSYNVLTADYEVTIPIGDRNMPVGRPTVGLIHVVIESNMRDQLVNWAFANDTRNGEIVFSRSDQAGTMKTLRFEDAFCIRFHESFDAQGSIPMRAHLTLSVRVLELMGSNWVQSWPGFGNTVSDSSDSGTTDTSGQASGFNLMEDDLESTTPEATPGVEQAEGNAASQAGNQAAEAGRSSARKVGDKAAEMGMKDFEKARGKMIEKSKDAAFDAVKGGNQDESDSSGSGSGASSSGDRAADGDAGAEGDVDEPLRSFNPNDS